MRKCYKQKALGLHFFAENRLFRPYKCLSSNAFVYRSEADFGGAQCYAISRNKCSFMEVFISI